jgi:chemotaxis protein methyltransferase CheR
VDAQVNDPELDHELPRLLETIYARWHYDFRQYAQASMRRRVTQALARLALPSVAALRERVVEDAKTFQQLLPYLTVPVSEMFRDPDFFRVLRERVAPLLRTYPSVRVWAAGCSTGEEVYALAILLREEGLEGKSLVYATDISTTALEKAEAGIYDVARMAGFSRDYLASGGRGSLSDYYTAAYEAAVFDRSLRQRVVFSDHSLATDQVFAEVQLVTCRNVLIYFNADLQDRAVGLFNDALCNKGFLGLGSKETLRFSRHAAGFAPFAPDVRIYRKR